MIRDEDISWYHGKISRETAEEKLLSKDGHKDGLFLVRESASSTGDYVLSVLCNDEEVSHFQIIRHAEDAFFSIDECLKFHGLESLIEHYLQHPLSDGLILTDYLKGEAPPHDSRRHGRTNLLHRATHRGNYTVVSELLKAGYRHEAKNQDGQTAVHLASITGKNRILRKLIEHDAIVNLRDTAGFTPLHYACQNNHPATVRLLVQTGGANIQARNTESGAVPLHEAATCGHKEVVRELLSLNAPVCPRNNKKHTPSQLARENGFLECADILDKYKCPSPKTNRNDWYHGTLGRQEAEEIIKQHSTQCGTYLVRFSERNKLYVLTMQYENCFYNYIIKSEDGFLFIDDGPLMTSLEHFVEYYSFIPDGLPTTLQTPVPPKPKPPVPEFSTMPRPKKSESGIKPITQDNQDDANSSDNKYPSQFQNITFTGNFNNSINNNNCDNEEYISTKRLIRGPLIGEGEFASVYEGTYNQPNGKTIKVAIKMLHDDQMQTNRDAFLTEAQVMMKLNHHCVVRLIGLCNGPQLLMVQELNTLGSILQYMAAHPQRINAEVEFKIWAAQIACGMKYLEEQRFVHRDLAARNILLASPNQAKISDFGLSRALGTDHEYYRALAGGKWPLKWYAPESYNYGQFSHKSDVWSFGVTIWEMYGYGAPPYGDLKGSEAIKLIDAGKRLTRPASCPKEVYAVMLRCWDKDPEKRPSFSELVEIFICDSVYTNIREMLPENDLA